MGGTLMKNLNVQALLDESKRKVSFSIAPHETLQESGELMNKYNVGLLVVLVGFKMVGVISERDIVYKGIAKEKNLSELKVEDVMTSDVLTVSADETFVDCLVKFKKGRCRHLPVVDDKGHLLGVIAERDITAYLLKCLDDK